MTKVSIIIPTYNCEEYISETLSSILNQTHKDSEIIIVDDGSTDNTREIVSSYSEPVKLITQSNQRVCAARNRGIKESTGEYICCMDHDDYWYPEKLELQLKQFNENPEVGLVYTDFLRWYRNETNNFPSPESIDRTKYLNEIDTDYSGWVYHQLLVDCWILTSTAMIKREVFETCGYFDKSLPYSEDWDLWIRISQDYQMIKIKNLTTLYRQHQLQGNKVARPIDYRTELLEKSAAKWGLCSKDGRCISKSKFNSIVCDYHRYFGLQQLEAGNRPKALQSFLKAWRKKNTDYKSFVCLLGSLIGWKPKQNK